ncbi:NAD(P)H-binding protein [Leeuwenhoekiella aequorea]|uniref:NAD-dependent epimerase/dehydratase family protein n=1 Tax=Leeuwenhoekiella aequorea TaxID=283736 RepID=A0A4Q0PBS2_9FLAO|nr:NAD(P)H-binding protein [Leeuwenhoekiella aequorea]AOE07461.1 nucleoside-diphosphate sugar epimerase [uncultured bacterium]AOE11475.1 nucleoside-diphosphate sugar epimerase [uncultured bacterium]RXG24224.1 NAD-dependent epimerase/dehydratase family protein [Leeuwenhoekiella aequorea]
MGKTAILLGITGLIGNALAKNILEDSRYDKLISFHRRKSGIVHPKLEEHIVDLFDLEKYAEQFKGDVVFCCIGTTQAKTDDKETYKKIDYGIPVAAAKLSAYNNIPKFIAISALGANPSSSVFYNKTKGEMERDVLKQNVNETYFLQPSLLAGYREEQRILEKLAIGAFKVLNPLLIGPLKKYQSIKPEPIVATMQYLAFNTYSEIRIESDEIKKIAN